MDSESLVCITISTQFGIDICSYKIIDRYNFYIQTLRESGVNIVFEYGVYENKQSETDDIEPIIEKNFKKDIFNINDLLDVMEEKPHDTINSFIDLHGKSFNSSESFRIFDIIEKAYEDKYGYKIENGPVFQKYNELFRKIKIVERQTIDQYKNFSYESKVKIDTNRFETKIEESYLLLSEPHKNEKKLIETLEFIMNVYRVVQRDEKLKEKENRDEKERLEELERKKHLIITKNKFGMYIYTKYNLVLDPTTKNIIGTDNRIGGIFPLDWSGKELCEKLKLKYV